MLYPDPRNAPGTWTSGRRTVLGNRLVGGVSNSDHLHGTAADYSGTTEAALRNYYGPDVNILNEGDHLHVSGLRDVPFHGQRGVKGLVNGVDTSAPRGQSMLAQRKPRTLQDVTNGGLPPFIPQDEPLNIDSQPLGTAVNTGELARMAQTPHIKKGGVLGSGLTLGDIFANGLVGFAAGMGNPAPANSLNDARARMQSQTFDREQLAAKIEADKQERIAKAMEPPADFREAGYFNRLAPQQQTAFLTARDAMNPVMADVAQPDGSVLRTVVPRQSLMGSGGPQTQMVGGVTYYNVNGKWYDNPEGR